MVAEQTTKDTIVSVIIPAFDASSHIASAIKSCQTQTVADIEIIVVDDASTDGTGDVVRAISATDDRVRYFRNAINSGPSFSRNRAVAEAKGQWIALLDADDSYAPDRLEVLLALSHDADMVSDNIILHFEGTGESRRMIDAAVLSSVHLMSFKEFVNGCHYDSSTPRRSNFNFMHPMFRRSFLDRVGLRYDDRCRNGEDLLIYFDCLAAGARWIVTPEALYHYAVRDGSLTETVREDDRGLMISKMLELVRRPEIAEDGALVAAINRHRRSMIRPYYYDVVRSNVKNGSFGSALQLIRDDPDALRVVAIETAARLPFILRTLAMSVISRARSRHARP